MNLVIVELMSPSGYLSLKKISFRLSHPAAKRSGEDESRLICTIKHDSSEKRSFVPIVHMALVMEKKAFICNIVQCIYNQVTASLCAYSYIACVLGFAIN